MTTDTLSELSTTKVNRLCMSLHSCVGVVSMLTYMCPVNADDSDLTIRSCDNELFRVHARNLHEHSESFPAPSGLLSRPEDIVSLPETAETLELLFQFMYPQPQPNLRSLSFEKFAALTEAVEKYGVYPAQQVCNIIMAYVTQAYHFRL